MGLSYHMEIKNGAQKFELHFFVALERFELPQAEPESDVLPLHHKAICFAFGLTPFAFALQSYGDFLNCANFLTTFLEKILMKMVFVLVLCELRVCILLTPNWPNWQ